MLFSQCLMNILRLEATGENEEIVVRTLDNKTTILEEMLVGVKEVFFQYLHELRLVLAKKPGSIAPVQATRRPALDVQFDP